ncbi:two-component system, NarL family, sensor histidine kinase DesK [Thermoactinomyces sp. DSM 45891]|uniref:sensor histidine kinase n=1 Tax=Thermoactinomyces sp. DSM 45891 TaxID=1761907 RepID=UPI0009201CD0|nr:sensor histidine kinase [Thermoactinomyces sp. DSM 45891]SFX20849.1 two-component system, NarL family, sensor histidine kinase DesK [Thermoactinomyces sp. DSM 45891]
MNRKKSPFIYMWLIFMFYPLYHFWTQTTHAVLGSLLILALVLAFLLYTRSGGVMYVLVQLGLAFVICSFLSFQAITIFCYPAASVGFLPSRRKFLMGYTILLTLIIITFFSFYDVDELGKVISLAFPYLILLFALPFVGRIQGRRDAIQSQLLLAQEQIVEMGKNEERQRIARDLHDTLGHTLSLITLKGQLAEKLIRKDPSRAEQETRDIQITARSALKQVRELVSDLNFAKWNDEVDRSRQILGAAEIQFTSQGGGVTLTPFVENILAMCLRELVTNVVKHSKATTCHLHSGEEEGYFFLCVRDNGIGFSSEKQKAESHGLIGMRQRLSLVEGTLLIHSNNKGTMITVQIPKVIKHKEKVGER